MTNRTEQAGSLQAYPNISAAAVMLGVSPATLSRRKDVHRLPRGERDVVIAPAEVLRLATIYRKRSLNDVAQQLLDHARQSASEDANTIERDIEQFFEDRGPTPEDKERFRSQARQLLPADLASAVEAALAQEGEVLPEAVKGWQPRPQS
jgi:DNA-binding transcriptional regulator YdaS (Cro superfamily)